jgi:hypothetical protein
MYNYRSRFVHGAIKIPMDYCHYDASEPYGVYARDIDRHSEIATNALTSTLQTLARRGWTELSFAWKIIESSDREQKAD